MRGALLAIALSLVPLVTVVEVSGGMIEGITERYLAVGTFHLQVRFFEDGAAEDVTGLVRDIESLPRVVSASRIIEGVGLLVTATTRFGVTLRSYPAELLEDDPEFSKYLSVSGRLPEAAGVAVSDGVLHSANLTVGEKVSLVVARTLPNGRFVLKRDKGTVEGSFSTGYADLDGQSVLISPETAEALFPDRANEFIGIKVEDPFGDLSGMVREIEQRVPDGGYVYSWRELERGMFATFETTRALLIVVMAVIVAVAAITISSSLFILVSERESEIALLKSVGATAPSVRRAFVALGFVVGCIGTAIGTALGLLVSLRINELFVMIEGIVGLVGRIGTWVIGDSGVSSGLRILDPAFYLTRIPVTPRIGELAMISAGSIALATIAAWIPARRAGRIAPAGSLSRH